MPKRFCLGVLLLCACVSLFSQTLPVGKQSPVPDFRQQKNNGKGQAGPVSGELRIRSSPQQVLPSCEDTSSRLLIRKESHFIGSGWLAPTSDGNFVSPGSSTSGVGFPFTFNGFLVKFTPQGDTVWAKRLKGGYPNREFYLYKALELRNRDLLVVGQMSVVVPHNGTKELFMARLNPDGEYIWHKTFRYQRYDDTTSGEFGIEDIKESPGGDLYLTGAYYYLSPAKGLLVMKFTADGKNVWSTDIYTYDGFPKGVSSDIVGNEVRLFGTSSLFTSIYGATNTILVGRLNASNGDTLSLKTWGLPVDSTTWFRTINGLTSVVKLANGNYAVAGQTAGDWHDLPDPKNTFHFSVVEIGGNLEPISGYSVQSDMETEGSSSRITVFPNGNVAYAQMRYISSYSADMITGYIANRQLIRERYIPYRGIASPWGSNFLSFPDGSTVFTRTNYDSAAGKGGFEYIRLHNSDSSSSCLGINTSINRIVPMPAMIEYPTYYNEVLRNLVQETTRDFEGVFEDSLNRFYNCVQKSACDSLRVTASSDLLCVSGTLQLRVSKNKECGSLPAWYYREENIEQFGYLNDSTVQVRFKGPWEGYFVAQTSNCVLRQDSVYVQVLETPAALSLGPDRELCPGNTIVLQTGRGYASSLWQDGSSGPTYTVTKPGVYHVASSDACGFVFRDTVSVTAAPPIAFAAGPDRTICTGDTIRITAPAGFSGYSWSNNYALSSTQGQSVVVRPLVDTAYFVRAEKTPGCFAFDTVRVRVLHSPPVYLGPDTSFCLGDSVRLDAGPGFQSWSWNNGQTSRQVIIKAPGTYSVTGTTADGCKSGDTVQVLRVYSLPRVQLDKNPVLCAGTVRTLHAGTFSSYLWNTGALTPGIRVTDTGTYSVTVTDANGCRGRDTAVISTVVAPAARFLPPDTLLCSYGTLLLRPASAFSSYLWSTGSSAPSITVSQPGMYWLEVKDRNNCTGKDSIVVGGRQCLQGFFIPTAFTPNNDGKNDLFRPLLFGTVKEFRFTIYDRWGHTVFHTTEPGKGWDGKASGIARDMNVFAWLCTYRFEGEEPKTEKGTVTLIR